MRYCLDTNVFINSAREYYAFDIAPPFWEALVQWGQEKRLCSVELVYRELTEKFLGEDDPLKGWSKTHRSSLFVELDEATYAEFGQIANWVNAEYEQHQVEAFLDSADPGVIAYAKAHQLSVVTLERLGNHTRNPRTRKLQAKKVFIPNVCQHFHVRYLNTFDMLRELGFFFR